MRFRVVGSNIKICSSIEYTAANIASPASLKMAEVIYFPLRSATGDRLMLDLVLKFASTM